MHEETTKRVEAERQLSTETKKRKRLEQELAQLRLDVDRLEGGDRPDIDGGKHPFYPRNPGNGVSAAPKPAVARRVWQRLDVLRGRLRRFADEACIICNKMFPPSEYDKHAEECLVALIDFSVKNAMSTA